MQQETRSKWQVGRIVAGVLAAGLAISHAQAIADIPPRNPQWQRDVLPLLKNRCVKCHGPSQAEGELRLHDVAFVVRGGVSGTVVVPKNLEQSLLWKRVAADEMPEDRPLDAREKAVLKQWIESGAPGLEAPPAKAGSAVHWAFRKPFRPPTPTVRENVRLLQPIDSFVSAQLAAHGLHPNDLADRLTLARRLAFDLTGLPPAPHEVAAFVDDVAPDAYERYVDRLLASPHYGVRAARHWLDAAGYADSNGYFHADTDRPLAYKYRDYVVRSLNADLSFDRFVQAQLAGDELAGGVPQGPVSRETIGLLTATHFLRNGPDGTGESDGNPDERRADKYFVLEGTVQIIGSSLLGLTLQCARCHDHKFEPITQREYYQLQAIVAPAFNIDQWKPPNERVVFAATAAEITAWERRTNEHAAALARAKAELAAWEQERKHSAPSNAPSTTTSKSSEAAPQTPMEAKRKELQSRIESLEKAVVEKPGKLACVYDVSSTPPVVRRLERGQYSASKEPVAPEVPQVLWENNRGLPIGEKSPIPGTTGRRLAFARWLTAPNTPAAALLARVTVNRLWQQHFGAGIVATADNLGYSGAAPSHPELLEYLATELASSGWSTKQLVRSLVTSATFRQSSRPHPQGLSLDPDNVYLWRARLRRLDADGIRDALLAVSGDLDEHLGGPYVPTRQTGVGEVIVDESHPGARRRSLYLQQRRTQMPSLLAVFDAPSVTFNCTRRPSTTIPLQSLSLLNSDFARTRAARFAARISDAGDADARVRSVFELAIGRPPSEPELSAARRFVATSSTDWTDFCQMLLASNAFLYLE